MAKVKSVKWSIGADEPEDLQEFLSNDDIVEKNTTGKGKNKEVNWPGKGPFPFKVVQARVKPNKNGDDRIGVMLTLKAPKGSEAESWNGYMIWDGFNVTDQGAPFIKRWLKAMGLSWTDFTQRSKQDDQDPPHLVQIGKVKIEGGKDVIIRATVVVKPADDYNDDEHMEIGRYLPADDEDTTEGEDDGDTADEAVETFDAAEEEFDEDALREELAGMKKKALAKRATENDEDAEVEDLDKDGLIDLIVEQESPVDEEAWNDQIENLRVELQKEKVPALKKRCLRNDADADLDGMKKDDLIQFILEAELNAPPF